MTEEQEERFVLAFEQIAKALEGIHEIRQKQFDKQWPKRKEAREAVYSRLPSDEDLIRERQGASEGSLKEWLMPPEDESIGEREKAFLKAQNAKDKNNAGSQIADQSKPDAGSIEAPEDNTKAAQ